MPARSLRNVLKHPLMLRFLWVIYAILFYNSGLMFTVWISGESALTGLLDRSLAALFPLLLPGFFVVNRYLGCAGGQCRLNPDKEDQASSNGRMPGI